MTMHKGIPVSSFTESRLYNINLSFFIFCCIPLMGYAYFSAVYYEVSTFSVKQAIWYSLIRVIVIMLAFTAITIYIGLRRRAFNKNKKDYQQSLRIKEILDKFFPTNFSSYPLLDKEIGSLWKVFRVEHFLSDSLRAQLSGHVRLFGGPMKAYLRGLLIPNLLNTSSILFFENESGKTLRVLIPNNQATKEILVKKIESLKNNFPYNTHVSELLCNFSLEEENIVNPLSHPAFLDRLDASCRLPFHEKPSVSVKGILLQEGLGIGTALCSNGEQKNFFPTTFLKELSSEVDLILGKRIKEPRAIEAVQ